MDFEEFGRRIGITDNRITKILAPYLAQQSKVGEFIKNSFLTESSKRGYTVMYNTKRNYLNG